MLVYTGYEAMSCALRHFPLPLSSCSLASSLGPSIELIPLSSMSHTPADRENMRLAQQEFHGLPPPLLWLLAAATAICLLGGLQSSGQLKPISIADAPQ